MYAQANNMGDNHQFSTSAMKRLVKTETDKRVSADAATTLGKQIDGYGTEAAKEAITIANEKGRKTVRAEDIAEAVKRLQ
jgi:histone H3/H4